MIDQFVNFVIRPPRAEYDPAGDLLGPHFSIHGKDYERQDLQLVNYRGHVIECSHYVPEPWKPGLQLPCVIYCHGNSGCRADANTAAVTLLPLNITVFALDFSGSGLSGGDYVTLGKFEMEDLTTVVDHLRVEKRCSLIGLWGRSMGAVTALLYAASDPSVAGMVLDSPFWDLNTLILELVDQFKVKVPKFGVRLVLQYMRRLIRQRAHFDISELNCGAVASRCFIPALIGHGEDDEFIRPHHSDEIFAAYSGDKNIVKFPGDHNSPRPPFFLDSVSIFFHNLLHPPPGSFRQPGEKKNFLDVDSDSEEVLKRSHWSDVSPKGGGSVLGDFDTELTGDEIDQLTLFKILEGSSDFDKYDERSERQLDPGFSRSNSSLGRGRGLRPDSTQGEDFEELEASMNQPGGSMRGVGSSSRSLGAQTEEDEEEMIQAAIKLSLQDKTIEKGK